MSKNTEIELAIDYLISDNVEKAEAIFKTLTLNLDLSNSAYAGLSICHSIKNDMNIAKKFVELAKKKIKKEIALVNIAESFIYISEKKYDVAETKLMKAVQIDPTSTYVNYILGAFFMRIGNIEKSIKYYKTATTLNKNYWLIHLNLAVAYSKKDDYTNAAKSSLHALKLLPSLSNVAISTYYYVRAYPKVYWSLFGICFLVWVLLPNFVLAFIPLTVIVFISGILTYTISKDFKDLASVFLLLIISLMYYLTYP